MDGIETYWIWLIVGLALAALEMIVPGVYLIWMAMAALAIAALAFVSGPPLAMQIIAWVGRRKRSPWAKGALLGRPHGPHAAPLEGSRPAPWLLRRV